MKTPEEIVSLMLEKDAFSKWLSISILKISKGFCQLTLRVSSEMLNGFDIAHGGITYSMADSALAFAANSYGQKCVSIETSISHTRPCKVGDELIATSEEIYRGKTTAIYQITIKNQEQKLVAVLKGTVYISAEIW